MFPDLNSANIGIKLVQRFAHGLGVGHTLSGFRKPVADSSRGAAVEEMVGDIAMVVLAASEGRKERIKMEKEYLILTLSPGSTSTKMAVFHGTRQLYKANVTHEPAVLKGFGEIIDHLDCDEFWDLARVTGMPGCWRQSKLHVLNQKETARRMAADLGIRYEDGNFIVAHVGGDFEMEALAAGAVRVLAGQEETREYTGQPVGSGFPYAPEFGERRILLLMRRHTGTLIVENVLDIKVGLSSNCPASDGAARSVTVIPSGLFDSEGSAAIRSGPRGTALLP